MFIEFALKNQVLKFGAFTLKSGRVSPYFFNLGLFDSGSQLAKLANYYAQIIAKSNIKYDVLFGPAYKGIPLVAAISTVLAIKYNIDIPYAFDRKEAKDHGEGGFFVGANVANKKVLLVDDVMTAATTFYDSYNKLKTISAEIVGVILSIDRQEKAKDSNLSATKKVSQDFNIPVLAITNFSSIFDYVKGNFDEKMIKKFREYHQRYGLE